MSAPQPQMIFVNLPVQDLEKSKAFFTALGYSFNPTYTNDDAAGMVISESIYVMLLTQPFFQQFTNKPIADAHTHTEVINALSAPVARQLTSWWTRHWPQAPANRSRRATTASCTSAASRTWMAISGKSHTWTASRADGRRKGEPSWLTWMLTCCRAHRTRWRPTAALPARPVRCGRTMARCSTWNAWLTMWNRARAPRSRVRSRQSPAKR